MTPNKAAPEYRVGLRARYGAYLIVAFVATWFMEACGRGPCICERGGTDGGNEEVMPWGEFAATLDVPDCPASEHPPLVVNTTADELDGGDGITGPSQAGEHLSFVEAMWIAFNRPGPDTILFDPDVFPVDEPETIFITGRNHLPATRQTCIDGRNRGVIVDWTIGGIACGDQCMWDVIDESLQVGLTLIHLPYTMSIGGQSQIAGCRIATDGHESLTCSGYTYTVDAFLGSVIGPGNVISGNKVAVRVHWANESSLIVANYFGYDPLTRRSLGLYGAIYLNDVDLTIAENVFAATSLNIETSSLPNEQQVPLVIRHNYFGVDKNGGPLSQPAVGIYINGSSLPLQGIISKIGPGNIIENIDTAVVVRTVGGYSNQFVRITRNSISRNNHGILFAGGPTLGPPTITSASSTRVIGTCPVDGTVEVFSDPGDQGETFLGEIQCDLSAPWTFNGYVPPGRNVTTTLTDTSGRTSSFSAPRRIP